MIITISNSHLTLQSRNTVCVGCVRVCLYVCCIRLFVHFLFQIASHYVWNQLQICLSSCLSVFVCVCLLICLSIYMYIHVYAYLYMYASTWICMYVHLYNQIYIYICVYQHFVNVLYHKYIIAHTSTFCGILHLNATQPKPIWSNNVQRDAQKHED